MNGIRKVLSLLLAVAMLLPTLALPSFAAEEETILFSYDFSNLAVGEKLKGNSSKADTFSSLHGNTDTSPAVIACITKMKTSSPIVLKPRGVEPFRV